MHPRAKRAELDQLAEFHSLDESAVDSLFFLAHAHPTRAESWSFVARCLQIGGLLSLAAGVVFFVAANWGAISVFGRLALIEAVLVVCAVLACWRPPPSLVGRAALFLAFIATGALLALFGQTYQTGADIYELFLTWTLLGLPIALVARWSVSTAAWVAVLNVALLLYCGWQPAGGMLWVLLGERLLTADLGLGAAWLNLILWFAAELWRPAAVPGWVRRLLVSCAFLFATWSGILAVLGSGRDYFNGSDVPAFSIAPLALLAAWAATLLFTLRRRDDIYPLALVLGSFIVVSMFWLARAIDSTNAGVFLFFALYLVATSTAGGRVLLGCHRRWRGQTRA